MEAVAEPEELSPGVPGEPPGPGLPAEPRPEEPAEPRPEEPAEPRPEEPPEPRPEEPAEPRPEEPPEPRPEEPAEPRPEEPPEPRPEEPAEPRPEEPAEPRPEEPPEPRPEEPPDLRPEEPAEPRPEEPPSCEPEKLGLEEKEPPGLSEPEAAAGPPGLSVAAPAAGGAGEEEESSSEDESASAAPPAAPAEEPPAPAVPGGAEQEGGQEDSAEENEEERQERDELLEQYGQLLGERDRLRQASSRLQMRLAQLLRLRQGARRPRAERGSAQLYGQLLRRLQELRQQRELVAADCRGRLEVRERVSEERQSRAQAEWTVFQARKKAVTVSSFCRQLGGEAAAKAAEHIQDREWDKEQRVREARVENIRLKREIQNLETTLKAQAEEAEGQPFVDLEQMKKENQKHSKRVDDLSDEILKLKKKVANAVHILSQFREKLQFVEADNAVRKAELMDIETDLAKKRDVLTKSKQVRDRLRKLNLKLLQQCGLLGNEILLRDLEEKVDAEELLSQQLETLKRHHAGLIVTCRGIQKKIKKANSSVLTENN